MRVRLQRSLVARFPALVAPATGRALTPVRRCFAAIEGFAWLRPVRQWTLVGWEPAGQARQKARKQKGSSGIKANITANVLAY
jgi:hypothetical protein